MISFTAVFFVSCAALAHEVLLVRFLHIVYEHHFASMILSLALMGYGAGATGVTLAQRFLLRRPVAAFTGVAIFLSCAQLVTAAGLSRLSFNPLEILWDVRQLVRLAALYAWLSLPFFAAGMASGLVFRARPESIHRLYLADLLGAALGTALAVNLLHVVNPVWALRLVSALAASAPVFLRSGKRFPWALMGVLVNLALQLLVSHSALTPTPYPYKGLALARQFPESRVAAERFGPMGWVTVLESPHVPFRSLSGWSLSCTTEAPSTPLGLFVDGAGPFPLFAKSAFSEDFSFRHCLMGTLPYRLTALEPRNAEDRRALLLGLEGNLEIVVALLEGISYLEVVERNAHVTQLISRLAWGLTPDDRLGRVTVHVTDPRRFLCEHSQHYDVIVPVSLGALSASAAGAASLMEVYEGTVEAFTLYLDRLTSNGCLALPHSLMVPPRSTLRFVATAQAALRRRGTKHPHRHLALMHDWNTALLLVKKSEITPQEQDFIGRFAEERSFDVAYLPDMSPKQAQRFHVSSEGSLAEAVTTFLTARPGELRKTSPFALDPVTDNRPYVFHFLHWKTWQRLLSAPHDRTVSLLSWGVPVLVLALAQALVAAGIFIAAPLAFSFRGSFQRSLKPFGIILIYFGALGMAFLLVETVVIQKNVFLLGHPVYGFAGTVGSFLLWAGLGSLASRGWVRWLDTQRVLRRRNKLTLTAFFAGFVVAIYGGAWAYLVPWAQGLPDLLRWAYAVVGIAPVAFFLGMPMPLGLGFLARTHPDLVPWAWAVNGCASVLSALVAVLAAMTYGFLAVLAAGAALYGAAALSARGLHGSA
ncbi:MAG: hypothetical protein ACUVWY_00255 [Desulfosoma sp.]|uniref:hypothetical protein n=1 Tax=Desulfosoma sp. TaxID=2603217 RepID=UPI00404AA9E3